MNIKKTYWACDWYEAELSRNLCFIYRPSVELFQWNSSMTAVWNLVVQMLGYKRHSTFLRQMATFHSHCWSCDRPWLIKRFTMICRLLFLLSITLGFAASSDIDFQDGELLSNFGAEPNSVVLASEPQNGLDEFGKVATAPPNTAWSSEAPLIQSNNDECPYDPTQSPSKMQSKRESPACYPSTGNSVLDSGHDPSKKDPQDNRGTNKKDSQGIAQPNRNSQESDCAAMPSAPTPVCAVVSEHYIRLHLVYPMSGLLAGWWQLLYARTGSYTPLYPISRPGLLQFIFPEPDVGMPVNSSHNLSPAGLLPGGGRDFFLLRLRLPSKCCSEITWKRGGKHFGIPFADFDKNANNNLRYPIVSSQHNPSPPLIVSREDTDKYYLESNKTSNKRRF